MLGVLEKWITKEINKIMNTGNILKVITWISLTALLLMKALTTFEYLVLFFLLLIYKNQKTIVIIKNEDNR